MSGVRSKFSWGFHLVGYGGRLHLECAVCDVTVSRHINVSKTTLSRSVLMQYEYSSTRTLLILCVIALNINYQRSTLGYRRKIHSTLRHSQQFKTAIISGCALKQRSKTHSSVRQSNLLLQSRVALMSRRIRAVEHRCAAGLVGGLQDRIFVNYTRIENAYKVRKKTFVFLLCIEVQQTFSFYFSLLRHYQMPECS